MTTHSKQDHGQLYIVALPIGNPEDITLRALRVLKDVDCVIAEDTRVFAEFAAKHGLKAKALFSYHDHNERESTEDLLKRLKKGQTIAQVSDAGTPGINDPGYHLVRAALSAEIKITPIPGASSLTAALSICPIGGGSHFFGGFPAAKTKERIQEFTEARSKAHRLVFFEAPHRIREHLEDALLVFGDVEVALFRELTKTYEEIVWGKVSQTLEQIKQTTPKGEFVVIYSSAPLNLLSLEQTKQEALVMIKNGNSLRDIREQLKSKTELTRKQLYDLLEEIKITDS